MLIRSCDYGPQKGLCEAIMPERITVALNKIDVPEAKESWSPDGSGTNLPDMGGVVHTQFHRFPALGIPQKWINKATTPPQTNIVFYRFE